MKKTILLIDAGYLHPILREEGIFYDANMIAQIAKYFGFSLLFYR
jgi:hypothetical protein